MFLSIQYLNFLNVPITGPPKKILLRFAFGAKYKSLCTNEKCKSHYNNNSSKVYLLLFSESALNKIGLYFVGLVKNFTGSIE